MNIEKQLKDELLRRASRAELESCTDLELLKKFALQLFDQNEAHRQLLLLVMKNNLVGE